MDILKFLPIIGVLIFIFVLLNIDISTVTATLLKADAFFISMVLLLHIPVLILKATKWKLITNAYGCPASIKKCFYGWLTGFVIGIVTPGRIGEFTKAYYLKDEMPTGGGISTIIIDRIIDIIILFVLAMLGGLTFLFTYSGYLQMDMIITLFVLFILFIIMVLFLLTREKLVRRLSKPLFRRFFPKKYKSRMRKAYNDFYEGLGKIRKGKRFVAASVIIAVIAWGISLSQYKLIAMAMNIDLGFLYIMSIMPLITLLDTLPISFSGLGTRDVMMIFFFSVIGLTTETAVSFSVMVFFLAYVIYIPFGIISFMMRPMKAKAGDLLDK